MPKFSIDLDLIKDKVFDDLEHAYKTKVVEIFNAVIRKTPVLTSRMINSWHTSVGIMKEEDEINGLQPSSLLSVAKLTGNEKIYLTNNVPYAAPIEYDGWSRVKAPQGMIRITIAEYGSSVKRM